MRTFAHYAFSISAVTTLLAGCTRSPSSREIPQSPPSTTYVARGGSWMLPEARDQNLLYAAANNVVDVYTYPRGRLVGALGSFNGAESFCTDKAGDVFVAVFYDAAIYEYPHGSTKQIAVLSSPYPVLACSVDPKTENVAAATYLGAVIFPNKGRGRGYGFAKVRLNPLLKYGAYCSYDERGNLFMDGVPSSGSFALSELPKGSKTFESITLDQNIHGPGALQWRGKNLSVADRGNGTGSGAPAVLYRFAISGSSGTKVSKTTLTGSSAYAQFWIQGNKAIGPEAGSTSGIGLWSYPTGGVPSKTITGPSPTAVIVSL